MNTPPRELRRALAALCVTEITSWGTLYYALPAMAAPLSRDTGWPVTEVMGAFSAGLVVCALAGIGTGRLLDRIGPRPVMTAGSALGVVALLAVAVAPSLPWFLAAWTLAGLAESALLYPPAFAALTRWYGPRRVRALTTLSLVAGLASTVFAPLTAALVARLGWRATDVALAVLLGVVTLPLHAAFLTPAWPRDSPGDRPGAAVPPGRVRSVARSRSFAFLAIAMTLAAFGAYAATVDLAPLLAGEGMSAGVAALALGLVGVGQVCGRLGYPALARRTSPATRTCAVLAAGAVTTMLLAVTSAAPALVLGAAVLAGASRGSYTLIQATAVSDRWGTAGFGTLNGIFTAPVTTATALAPSGGTLLAGLLGTPFAAYCLLASLIAIAAAVSLATR